MAASWLYDYHLGARAIEVRFLGVFKMYEIEYADIEEVRLVPAREALRPKITTLGMGNRIGRIVEIKKRTGVVRSILVTPKDPESFVRLVSGMIPGRDLGRL